MWLQTQPLQAFEIVSLGNAAAGGKKAVEVLSAHCVRKKKKVCVSYTSRVVVAVRCGAVHKFCGDAAHCVEPFECVSSEGWTGVLPTSGAQITCIQPYSVPSSFWDAVMSCCCRLHWKKVMWWWAGLLVRS
jgi:hypothetical protein